MASQKISRAGFGPEKRVRKRREFLHVQAVARRVTTPHFVFLIAAQLSPAPAVPKDSAPKPEASDPAKSPAKRAVASRPPSARIGFIVTRKVGVAVVRNRIRRLCRECFRLWPRLLPGGVDMVVVARQGAEELGLEGVRAEWTSVGGLLRRRAEEALARRNEVPHLSRGPRTPS